MPDAFWKALGWLGAGGLAIYFWRRLMPQGPAAPTCSRQYPAFNHGGARDMANVSLIVLHSTEGPSALSTARWFATPLPVSEGGPYSAHVVVGDDGCYRCVDDGDVAWAASIVNPFSLNLEQAGYAAWTRDEWLSHDATLRAAGGQVGGWSREFDIPLRFLRAADLLALQASGWDKAHGGVTTHHEISRAWPASSTHVDPGDGYPLDVLFSYAGGTITPGAPIARISGFLHLNRKDNQ